MILGMIHLVTTTIIIMTLHTSNTSKMLDTLKHVYTKVTHICSYGQDGAYANYPVGEQELVAKQQDEGSFIDRFFLGGGGGIPLPLAITLFLVDLVVHILEI